MLMNLNNNIVVLLRRDMLEVVTYDMTANEIRFVF